MVVPFTYFWTSMMDFIFKIKNSTQIVRKGAVLPLQCLLQSNNANLNVM